MVDLALYSSRYSPTLAGTHRARRSASDTMSTQELLRYGIQRDRETHTFKGVAFTLFAWCSPPIAQLLAPHTPHDALLNIAAICGPAGLFGAVATVATFPAVMKGPKAPAASAIYSRDRFAVLNPQ